MADEYVSASGFASINKRPSIDERTSSNEGASIWLVLRSATISKHVIRYL